MDLCVFDWAIFSNLVVAGATIFTGVVAWCIYREWSKQKGSEVIADESKQVIKDVLEAVKIISFIDSGAYTGEVLVNEFEKFLKVLELVVVNTAFIEDSIIDNELSKSLSLFSEKFLKIKILIKDRKIIPGSRRSVGPIREFNESAIDLVNSLNPYSVYMKTCKFKNKGKLQDNSPKKS